MGSWSSSHTGVLVRSHTDVRSDVQRGLPSYYVVHGDKPAEAMIPLPAPALRTILSTPSTVRGTDQACTRGATPAGSNPIAGGRGRMGPPPGGGGGTQVAIR